MYKLERLLRAFDVCLFVDLGSTRIARGTRIARSEFFESQFLQKPTSGGLGLLEVSF